MSIPALVPEQDRAPSLASRIVTVHATDITEGAPAPDAVTFALPCALRVPGDDVILRPGGVRVRLVDGRAQVRLPVYGGGAVRLDGSDDWLIKVTPSWGGEYGIRVPAGSGEISLADLPAVRPLTRREVAYAITGVGVTVTEGAHAGGTAEYRNGQLDFTIQVPAFRPQTVYPYIDETADARAQHYGEEIRSDLDDRLEQVTTAYDLAVALGYEGDLSDWLESLVGPKGDQGDDSTVPGPPNVLSIGDVTTGDAGSEAAATITGTAPEQVLGLTIPRGDKGDKGDASTVPGPTGKTAYQYAQDAGFEGTEEEFADAQLPDSITWENVDGKPAEYPPDTHTHTQDEVDGLTDRLGAIENSVDALEEPGAVWEDLTTSVSDVESAGHGAPPQILRNGAWRYLRGRYKRTTGTNFTAGANYGLLNLAPDDVPTYTQGGMGQTTGAGFLRVEIGGAGAVTGRPSVDTGWVGLDGIFWTTN